MSDTHNIPGLITIDQLARRLGTSERHIRRWVAERRVPYVKAGRLVRFDLEKIAAWLDAARKPAHSAAEGRH